MSVLNLLQYCFGFLTMRHMKSSLARDQTHTPALEGDVLTTEPSGKSLQHILELDILLFYTCWLTTFSLVVMHIIRIKCYTSLLMSHTEFLGHLVFTSHLLHQI